MTRTTYSIEIDHPDLGLLYGEASDSNGITVAFTPEQNASLEAAARKMAADLYEAHGGRAQVRLTRNVTESQVIAEHPPREQPPAQIPDHDGSHAWWAHDGYPGHAHVHGKIVPAESQS